MESRIDDDGSRKLYLCPINSRIEKAPSSKTADPPTKNGAPPSPKMVDPTTKNGGPPPPKMVTKHINITNINKQQKETEKPVFLPDDKPIENREDATTIWNKSREYWNERGLKPECRDIMMRPADVSEILPTFQHYSWAEIRNAIGNFAWHRFKAGPGFKPPPSYGSLAGFLKTGVEKYHDDNALDQQFKEAL